MRTWLVSLLLLTVAPSASRIRCVARRSGLAVIVVIAVLAGCAPRGERGAGEEIPGVVPAPEGLKFSVRVAPQRFTPGDRVLMEATLFNDSADEYRKKFRTRCIWDYELTTLDGIPLRAARECVPQDTTLVMAPGELGMIVREWRGRQRYFNTTEYLVPGRYLVVAGFLDADHRVIPMSVPVEIEVMPLGGAR